MRKVSGRPAVRAPRFQGHGPRLNPWMGALRSHKLRDVAKRKKQNKTKEKKPHNEIEIPLHIY